MNNKNGSFPPPTGPPASGEPIAPVSPRVDVFGNSESPFGPVVEGGAQRFADFANNSTLTAGSITNESAPQPSPLGDVQGFTEAPAVVARDMLRTDSVLKVPDSALAQNRPPMQG